jgi:hypothetical protein
MSALIDEKSMKKSRSTCRPIEISGAVYLRREHPLQFAAVLVEEISIGGDARSGVSRPAHSSLRIPNQAVHVIAA